MTANCGNGAVVRLGMGVGLADMKLASSDDGQYLLIICRRRIVAMVGSMGGDVELFEFADALCLSAMELMEQIAPVAQCSVDANGIIGGESCENV